MDNLQTASIYRVDVVFANDGEAYGADTHYLECDGPPDRDTLDALVEQSVYDDDRFPDRSWSVAVDKLDGLPPGKVARRIPGTTSPSM